MKESDFFKCYFTLNISKRFSDKICISQLDISLVMQRAMIFFAEDMAQGSQHVWQETAMWLQINVMSHHIVANSIWCQIFWSWMKHNFMNYLFANSKSMHLLIWHLDTNPMASMDALLQSHSTNSCWELLKDFQNLSSSDCLETWLSS